MLGIILRASDIRGGRGTGTEKLINGLKSCVIRNEWNMHRRRM